MATRWTDPTMMLIFLLPLVIGWISSTGYFAYLFAIEDTTQALFLHQKVPTEDKYLEFAQTFGLIFVPTFAYMFLYRCYLGQWFEDKSIDTEEFVIYRDPAVAKYYKHRLIPMCEFYEDYMECKVDWNTDCEGGDCYLILRNHRHKFVNYKVTWRQIKWLLVQFFPQWMTGAGLGKGSSSGKSVEETTKEIDEHYNKGNDVFSCILGRPMVYTCGIFHEMPKFASDYYNGDYVASATDGALEDAQNNKMDMLCDKIQLKEGETLLDIGCGWGTLVRHASYHYGANATGVTLSREGKIYCDMASEKTGIDTEIMLCDYRNIPQDQQYDKITCIEMAEHVGVVNFVDPYLKNIRRLLKPNPDALFMMQVAGLRQGSNWQDVAWGLFMGKYVFPGADASTPLNWYIRQCERAGFEVHSVETIGNHYGHTLHKWYDNWMSHKEEILAGKIDAISEHTKGEHLFRLNELTWAWCTIHANQGGGTCYQILMHPCEYTYDRDIFVNGQHVSNGTVTGVGYAPMEKNHEPGQNPVYVADWGTDLGDAILTKTPSKRTRRTPAKKSSTKKRSTKKASTRKSTPRSSRKKRV